MGSKVFLQSERYKLVSDERDIMLPARYKIAVLEWCRENNIEIESPGTNLDYIAEQYFGVSLWRIKDESQRMWFLLRWI